MSASISNYFAELREDVEGAYYGFYFMEIADYYCKEANDEREMLKLLYQSLRAVIKDSIPNRLIRRIFELKAACINGKPRRCFSVWCAAIAAGKGIQCEKGRQGLHRMQ